MTNIFNANWNRSQQPDHQLLYEPHGYCHAAGNPGARRQGAELQPAELRTAQHHAQPVHRTERAATQLLDFADHLALRDAELDSRQAQSALRRRLPARASRLSGRLERHRKLHLQRPVHRGRQRTTNPPARAGRFSARPAAVHHHRRVHRKELSARQRDGRLMRRTTGGPSSLTLNYGLRYEFFAPYTEKYGHLALVDTNPGRGLHQRSRGAGRRRGRIQRHAARFAGLSVPHGLRAAAGLCAGALPQANRGARGGFGMNYTVGQYAHLCHHHGAPAALGQ